MRARGAERQCAVKGSQSLAPAGCRWLSSAAGVAVRQPRIALRDSADRTDPELSAENMEKTHAKQPTEPIDRMDPAEPAESGERDEPRSVPMSAFSHCRRSAMRAPNG